MQWEGGGGLLHGQMGIALYGLLKAARCLLLKTVLRAHYYNFFVSCLKYIVIGNGWAEREFCRPRG